MFIFSIKLNKFKLAIACIVAAILIFSIVFINMSNINLSANSKSVKIAAQNIKTNEDRISYLKSLGLEVSNKPIETVQVIIPKEFDKVFNQYNELQKSSGLDLSKYKNTVCTRYCYEVYNLKNQTKDPVRVNLFIYQDKVVAGDISTVALDGFMVSLNHFIK